MIRRRPRSLQSSSGQPSGRAERPAQRPPSARDGGEEPPRRRIRPRMDGPPPERPATRPPRERASDGGSQNSRSRPRARPVDGDEPGRRPRTRPVDGRAPDGSPRARPADTRDPGARRRTRPAPSWFDEPPPARPRRRTDTGSEPEPRRPGERGTDAQPRRPRERGTDAEPRRPRERGTEPEPRRPRERGTGAETRRPREPGRRPARATRPLQGRRTDPPARRPTPRGRATPARPPGRLALPGGITLPSPVRPRPRGRSTAPPTTTRRLTALLLLAAIGVGIAALVGAFSSGDHGQPVPKLPAISARSIASQRGAPATVALDTTFGGDHPPTGKLSTLELDLARGFHFDPRAAATCTPPQAHAGTCPADSAIGSGSGEILVHGPYLPRTNYDVTAAVYLTAPTHRGDMAGLALDIVQAQSQLHATLLGRVIPLRTSRYSIALRFANASNGLSRDYELILRQIALKLQAGRTVDSQTYHLLTNPTPCVKPGWPVQLSMTSATNAWIYHGTASCSSSTS